MFGLRRVGVFDSFNKDENLRFVWSLFSLVGIKCLSVRTCTAIFV